MIARAENLAIYVKQELERRYPDCRVVFMKVQKNNGLMLQGLTIAAPEDCGTGREYFAYNIH